MASPFEQLRERKVVQWSLAYLAAAWICLEALAFATDTFALPLSILRAVTVLSAFGAVGVVVVAWFHGERGAQRVGPLEGVLLLALVVGAVGGAVWAARPPLVGGFPVVPAAAARSVAVLPFVNLGGRADEEYFSDGVTEEILNTLAQLPGLHVAARSSSFAFRGRDDDARSIGRSLGVVALLQGSVRRDRGHLKITAQLVDAETGYNLWANTFDRSDADVFAVQGEIARAIANALELRLAPEDVARRLPTRDAAAYDLYLQGRQAWNERTEASLRRAVGLFEQALEADPGFARAYSGIADAYGLLEDYGEVPAEEAFPRAIRAAQHALEIDETLAEAHAALGHVQMHQLQWQRAEEAFRRALALNPSYANAHHWYSLALLWTGRYDEALEENRLARTLDPRSEKFEESAGMLLSYAGRPEDAEAHLATVVSKFPTNLNAYRYLALAQSLSGRHEEAIATTHRMRALPGGPWPVTELRILAHAGRDREARAALEEVLRTDPELPLSHQDIHAVLVALGDHDEAIAVIGRAESRSLLYLGVDPVYDPIRGDPRFEATLGRLGLSGVVPAGPVGAAPRPAS